MKKAIKEINNDILPSMIDYNDHNSFNKVCNTFPNGWDSIPNFNQVIQNIANNRKTPLEEMNKRRKQSEDEVDKKNNETLDYELSKATWNDFTNFDLICKK
jgi:hypothetical protein